MLLKYNKVCFNLSKNFLRLSSITDSNDSFTPLIFTCSEYNFWLKNILKSFEQYDIKTIHWLSLT